MENIYQSIILAIIQGLTEFLPVSSSAHLILLPKLLHWADQGLAFDVFIHLGTLVAVIAYFRKELILMFKDCIHAIQDRRTSKNLHLALAIAFGTIPVGIVGLILNDFIALHLRAAIVIAITTIVFGILLAIATLVGKQTRNEYSLTWKDVFIIGCAQAIALIPGTSRSGITLTAGLFVGLKQEASARYSFLLSIPVIILASVLQGYKLFTSHQLLEYQSLLISFVVAAITGYLCIGAFLKLLQKYGMMPFVVYRLILGIILLAIFI